MTSIRRRLALLALPLVGAALGCAQLESDKPNAPVAAITIGGPNAVVVGQTITLTVKRGGQQQSIQLKLGTRPQSASQSQNGG